MEQKNTIVKCKAHPNCLFNYNGICDNYVINIGADEKCESYVETESKLDIDDKHLEGTATVKMKIAELDKPNKNKSTIRKVVPKCDLPTCDWLCKHALSDGPSFNPYIWCDLYKMNPAMGLFCSLKEEKNEI